MMEKGEGGKRRRRYEKVGGKGKEEKVDWDRRQNKTGKIEGKKTERRETEGEEGRS